MTASPFDSAHLHRLFPTGDTGRLFSDTAEIRAMMLVEGALAQVQAAQGVIPQDSADAIHRAGLEIQIDPGALAHETAAQGCYAPAMVAQFRAEMQAPEHAQYLQWGADARDIQDTALMLRLRQALSHQETRLRALVKTLTAANQRCWPVLTLLEELPALRAGSLWVALSGDGSDKLGSDPQALRAALAGKLALNDPGQCWHFDRSPVLRIANWFTRSALACAQITGDAAPAVTALTRQAQMLLGVIHMAATSRDLAGNYGEWLSLPQLVLSSASTAEHTQSHANTLPASAPDTYTREIIARLEALS